MNRYTAIPNQRSHMNGGIFILILLAVITLTFTMIQVTASSHAYLAHGPEAEQTRKCIEQNGVWKAYREPKTNALHWLCKDPTTGTIFDMIVEKLTETQYREKTAFRPKRVFLKSVLPSFVHGSRGKHGREPFSYGFFREDP